ncbi:MAG: hypothetical protein WCC61_07150 [Pseudomonas sp.]|jgi:hypothetical protein|uniref:hypothetical protein n=1 Tax=Pseudomonas sp. TaxID=306 RepID=UPI003C7D8043
MRDHLPSASKSFSVTDELAMAVDGAVARLCREINKWAIFSGFITEPNGPWLESEDISG